MADIFGVPVVKMATDEGAALGAALQAAWCAQGHRDADDRRRTLENLLQGVVTLDESTRCMPDESRHALYPSVQEATKRPCRGQYERYAP